VDGMEQFGFWDTEGNPARFVIEGGPAERR
jgi:hypothetical protein